MTMIERHPNGPRVYLLSRRVHHGLSGSLLAAAAMLLRRRRVALVFIVVAAHDAHDFPWAPNKYTPSQEA